MKFLHPAVYYKLRVRKNISSLTPKWDYVVARVPSLAPPARAGVFFARSNPSTTWRLLRRQKPRAAARNDMAGSYFSTVLYRTYLKDRLPGYRHDRDAQVLPRTRCSMYVHSSTACDIPIPFHYLLKYCHHRHPCSRL